MQAKPLHMHCSEKPALLNRRQIGTALTPPYGRADHFCLRFWGHSVQKLIGGLEVQHQSADEYAVPALHPSGIARGALPERPFHHGDAQRPATAAKNM